MMSPDVKEVPAFPPESDAVVVQAGLTSPISPISSAGLVFSRFRGCSLRSWSLGLCVGLPTLAAALYYGAVASDQYVAESRFAVRGAEAAPVDVLGALTGVPGQGGSAADAMIVQDFVHSREIVEQLEPVLGLREMFSRSQADWLARSNPTLPIEDFVDYWRGKVEVTYDGTSGIATLQVAAFSPDDAVAISQGILEASERLVNAMSDRARHDALEFTQSEVTRSEERLAAARSALTVFRDSHRSIDPARSAEAVLGIVAGLQEELAKTEAEVLALRSYMNATSAPVVSAMSKIKALKAQIDQEGQRLAGQGAEVMSGVLADYEGLMAEREFAEKAHVSALASLETTRAEAIRKQRYLATFVQPKKPEASLRPRRIANTIMVGVVALSLWALGLFALAAIRDHKGWK